MAKRCSVPQHRAPPFLQVTERMAGALAARAAALASSLQKTGALSKAHQLLADVAADIFDSGVRGQGLQSALVPLLRSELAIGAPGNGHGDESLHTAPMAEIKGGVKATAGRPANASFAEARAGALALLLREGSIMNGQAAARQAQLNGPPFVPYL